jgi:hypothetical protein
MPLESNKNKKLRACFIGNDWTVLDEDQRASKERKKQQELYDGACN